MRWIIIFTVLLSVDSTLAQAYFEKALEYRQKIGILAAHRGVMAHLPRNVAYAGELSLLFRTRGHKAYQKSYRFPTYGAALFYGSIGSNVIMGNFLGIYGFSDLPMIKIRSYHMDFRISLGLGYNGNTYDPVSNPLNVALASKLNGIICFAIKNNVHFGKNALTFGLDLTHFSNGAFKVPNFGINMPYLFLGYARTIVPVDPLKFAQGEAPTVPMSLPYKRWIYSAMFTFNGKQSMPIGGKRYPVYGLNLSGKYFFNHKAGLELDIDVFSKQAILDYQPYIKKSQWDIIQVGAYAAYLVPLDRFHFVFGMGAYLRDKYSPEDPVYHRIGARYYLKNGILFNVTLKTHFARADLLEYGIGYTFNYRKR
ncbi:MAG: acyloxyacyl hydrolase [Bacteroidetes bacterium]|nr:acyloxyacyl hydrolase [Bacteroidota bacterium]MBM3424946.1 acyloxyacyl hydrolase [Bacteroidota bacterium]